MPELPLVSPGEVIASDHINDIMLRTAQRYATVADRTAENPTPENGELAWMDAEGSDLARLAVFDGAGWLSVNSPVRTDLAVLQAMVGRLQVPAGSAQSPGLSLGPNEGMYLPGTDQIAMTAGGVTVFSATTLRVFLPAAYNDTTANAANMHFLAGGRVMLSTSARRYKSNIEPAPELADLDLEPVTFHHDGDDKDFIGFIADDMPDERAIVRDADGEVENYDLRSVVAILAAKVNSLTARVEALEA